MVITASCVCISICGWLGGGRTSYQSTTDTPTEEKATEPAVSSINSKCMSIQLAFSFQYTSGHCPRQGHYPRYTKYKEIKQAKFLLLEELKKEVLF